MSENRKPAVANLAPREWTSFSQKVEVVELIDKAAFTSCLECPVCLDVAIPPVYMCTTGHIICGACRKKVKCCALCSGAFQGARNFFYETLFEKTAFCCRYANEGCKITVLGKDMKAHQDECYFRPLPCVKYGCPNMKNGNLIAFSKFVEHFTTVHDGKINKCNSGKVCNGYPVDADTWLVSRWVHEVYLYKGSYFFATCQIRKPEVGVWLWILGSEELAERFRVKVALGESVKRGTPSPTSNSDANKKVSWTWEGPVHSIRKAADIVIDSGECLVTSIANVKSLCLNHDSRVYWEVYFEIMEKETQDEFNFRQRLQNVTTRKVSFYPYDLSSFSPQ